MKIAKNVNEVLNKYSKAELITTPHERLSIFTWGDMLKLRAEIEDLRAQLAPALKTQ